MSPDQPTSSRLRAELLEAREKLAEGREAVRRQHDLGMSGVDVGRKLTALTDAALIGLIESALADFPRTVSDRLRENLTLVAHGGYGRRQMAPFSDVDVMVLHRGRVDKHVERFTRRLTQEVFDIGLQMGQSLRTVEEALRMARSDAVIASSLVESRSLAGSQEVLDDFRAQFLRMIQRRKATVCAAFVEARREERNKYGGTVYLLEPNVKRSPGALRDLHLLRWLWYAHAGESDLDRLLMRGVISKFDHRRLVTARDFLMRVRNELHFHAGKESDALTRAEQLRVAQKLGFFGAAGLLPVEQFMRDYFRHAGHVGFLATRISELSLPTPTVDRVLGAVFGRRVEEDYQFSSREMSATQQGRAKLERHQEEAWRLLDRARETECRITQDTLYLVYRSAPAYSNQVTPLLKDRFLGILNNPKGLGPLLRQAHELGVLEKALPDFARARCLLQFNQYHKYTVDEHSIRAVEEATHFVDDASRLGETYREFEEKWLLHLALLVHDLGKGREVDHCVVGEQIADHASRRFGLSDADREDMKFVVREHLNMSRIALRRDITDKHTVENFAELVQTPRRLTLLYLLTCADLAGVGPGVLNKWKADMLGGLHRRTMDQLELADGRELPVRRDAKRHATWNELKPAEQKDPWYHEQYIALPESFLEHHSAASVARTLRRLRKLSASQGAAWGEYRQDLGAVELLAGVDQGGGRGAFSSMAGALSAAGMQIIQAETAMLPYGLLLLRYVAQDTQQADASSDERIEQLAAAMVASVDKPSPPKFRRVWGADNQRKQAALANQPSEIRLDATLTEEWLIVEVFAFDRIGLLYDLARTLHEVGLVIGFAKIGTSGDRVVDVFYVKDRDGKRPDDPEVLAEVRAKLEAVIDSHSREG